MDGADEQTRKQRELRRKRIIENAKNRMEKLKRLQQRTSSSLQETEVADESPNHLISEHTQHQEQHLSDDPPDEIIERVTPSFMETNETTVLPNSQVSLQPSFLCRIVGTIRSDRAFKIRTFCGLLCSLILTFLTVIYNQSLSLLAYMLGMELVTLVTIALMTSSNNSSSMRGDRILQVKGLLAFFHPLLPVIYETIYLSLYIAIIVLRDFIVMSFGLVVFMSIALAVYTDLY